MMPGIIPSLLMANGVSLSVVVVPGIQQWGASAPYSVTTVAQATGGIPPYTYNWNDTGPWPVDGNYAGQVKEWTPSGAMPSDAFVSVVVTDAAGNIATAGGEIRQSFDAPGGG